MPRTATLHISRDGRKIRTVAVSTRPLTIGSGSGCDVVLAGDGIAVLHARVQVARGRLALVNCDPLHGLTVGDKRVNQVALEPGVRARLAAFELSCADEPGGEVDATPDPRGRFEALLALGALLAVPRDREFVLERLLETLAEIFHARRGCLLVPDRTHAFVPAVIRDLDPAAVDKLVSGTVVAEAVATKRTVIHRDTGQIEHLQDAASIVAGGIRAVVCHPVVSRDRVTAVLYLDSDRRAASASAEDLALLAAFGEQAAAALCGLEAREALEARAASLAQMASDAVRQVHAAGEAVAVDPRTRAVLAQIERVAPSDTTVLLTGPSGTGKELLARELHRRSRRGGGPFIAVNCGALPRELVESELFGHEKGAFSGAVEMRRGKFELADGGTLFLDELGELPLDAQVKLLRALQERTIDRVGGREPVRVDIRLVAATNQDLKALVAGRQFRDDLYYRVNVFAVALPALAERPGDVEPLAEHFIREFNARLGRRIAGLAPDALAVLRAYAWPGNVRELRNVIERAFILEEGTHLTASSLPADVALARPAPAPDGAGAGDTGTLAEAVAGFEKRHILAALDRHAGNVLATAKALGVSRQTLYNKLQEHGLMGTGRRPR